jgi:predicted aspartyl protease
MRATSLVILALMALAGSARADNGCNLFRLAQVPMEVGESGLPTVPMTINGHSVKMLVDTGGVQTDIVMHKAVEFNLDLRRDRFRRMVQYGGAVIDQFVTVDEVALDQLTTKGMPFAVSPDDALLPEFDGTLAPNVLTQYDVDFDFGNGQFSLFSPKHCEGKVVYWTAEGYSEVPFAADLSGHILVPVLLDGKVIMAGLDTGAQKSTLSLETAMATFGFKKPGDEEDGIYTYPFQTLTMRGVTVRNPNVLLVPDSLSKIVKHGGPQMILGMTALRQLHLYIAYKERKLYITAASAH